MPPYKQKQQVDKRTPEEIAYQSAANSRYNICTPMLDAEYIRISHPVARKDMHMRTNSEQFTAVFNELASNGLRNKLIAELTMFGDNYDPKWHDVLKNVLGQVPEGA